MKRALRNLGIMVVALGGFGAPLFADSSVSIAALDLLSDASAFVADEANLETNEGKPDLMISNDAGPRGAELSISPSAQSLSTNVNKIP